VHRKVLFSGELETCDGTTATHDTLLLTVTQIGICLVSYQGNELTLSQRLFRRDLRAVAKDPVEEVEALLERRRSRAATDVNDRRDTMTELGRRGIMTYAERAALLDRSKAAWRMGHGNIAPYELLTGSGNMKLLEKVLPARLPWRHAGGDRRAVRHRLPPLRRPARTLDRSLPP
jgi:hypothetical protein